MSDGDYAHSPDYHYSIVALLLAGDIQARMVSNAEASFIEVSLIDGTKVLWSNSKQLWVVTLIPTSGEMICETESLPWDLGVDDAAKMIAMHDYPAPAEYPNPAS